MGTKVKTQFMDRRWMEVVIVALCTFICVGSITGCISIKNVPASKVSAMPEGKRVFFFHSGDSVRIVYPVTGEKELFTAVVVSDNKVPDNRLREVHIYASPPSAVKIKGTLLTCPIENIVKVENYRINAGTVITTICILLLLFTLPIYL
jgi:hypothetical protein